MFSSASVSSVLAEQLKHQTAALHREVESVFGFPNSAEEYVRQLEMFFGYLDPWEEQLRVARRRIPAVAWKSERVAWLKHDLISLGASETRLAELPRCSALPAMDTFAATLGSVYVWEGSTLGGQMIAQQVQRLGISPESTRYFSSYGPQVGPRWRAFKEQLAIYSSPESDRLIIASAQATFRALAAWSQTYLELCPAI